MKVAIPSKTEFLLFSSKMFQPNTLLVFIVLMKYSSNYKIGIPLDGRTNEDEKMILLPYNITPLYYNHLPAIHVENTICNLFRSGVVAVFLPFVRSTDSSLASSVVIEHIAQKWGVPVLSLSYSSSFPSKSISLLPSQRDISLAASAFIKRERWRDVVLLFRTDQQFLSMTEMISSGHFGFPFRTHLVRLSSDGDYSPALKHIKNNIGITRMIINCEPILLLPLFTTAVELKMCGILYHYVIVNMDSIGLELEKSSRISHCNFTLLTMIDPLFIPSLSNAIALNSTSEEHQQQSKNNKLITLSSAIWLDSISFLSTLLSSSNVFDIPSCSYKWTSADPLANNLAKLEMNGKTGKIRIGSDGKRINYTINIIGKKEGQLYKSAEWKSETGQLHTAEESIAPRSIGAQKVSLANKTLRVTVYMEAPFVVHLSSPDGKVLQGNDLYGGYCIDLLKMIANMEGFNYIIHEVADKAYGSKESSGKWSGMVGELQTGEADLAVASLTISYSRSEVIDFTVPFMHLGISILFKKPATTESNYFMFLSPLSSEVWMSTFASYLFTSLTIWLIARISPFESMKRDICTGKLYKVENQFGIRNSFWFTVSSLMQQGCELSPRSLSTRLVSAVWWFFTIILISSYTANLAAFLTTQRMLTPVENADDLAAQNKIKYGTLGKGSTMSFFNSKIDTYERMWKLMSSSPGLFVSSSKEGIARVKSSEYAYLMESSMLEYAAERDCELIQIGGLLDQKGYGIGLPKGSPYRSLISTAILRLQEKTVLTELKEKWWKDENTVCPQMKKKGSDDDDSVGGIFILLAIGLIISVVIMLVEVIIKKATTQSSMKENEESNESNVEHQHEGDHSETEKEDEVIGEAEGVSKSEEIVVHHIETRTSSLPTPPIIRIEETHPRYKKKDEHIRERRATRGSLYY